MKGHPHSESRSYQTPAWALASVILGLALCLLVIAGLNRTSARAQDSGVPQVWLPNVFNQAVQDPLAGMEPFELPSAAGERYLMQRLGLLPKPQSGAGGPYSLLAGLAVTDTLVNDPTVDVPENTTQSETSLAVQGDTLCAGYNDSGAGGFSGFSRSTDLGANWTDLGGIGQSGDPVLAVHAGTGVFYYAEIATIGGNPAIGVARSTDDCQSYAAAVDASPVASGLPGTTLNDKPWIAVDNTGGAGDGNVYVCWTRFYSNTSELRFSRSIDGGLTYQNEQVLSPSGTAPFGCSLGVGPAGEVYLAWADRAGANQNDIRFRSSVDAGLTFSAAVSASTGNRHPGVDTIVNCPTPANPAATRPTLTGDIRMLHQAWLAVDATGGPFDGTLYLVWASDPVGTPDNSDAFFSRSTDGGVTWSAAVQLGAGGGQTDQFEPFVAVGGAGSVSVAWYDRRNDVISNTLIDVYKAHSQDGGATLDPLVRLTDVNFPVPPINPNFDPNVVNCYMGEYIAVAGDAHNFYYTWGDNRNTLVTPNFPNGRPDPDVFFDTQPAPVVNTADLAIAKSDAPDPVAAGETLTYTLAVTNAGPDIALDVFVEDLLPSGVTYLSDTAACDTSSLPTLTCGLGDLLSGESRSFFVTVSVDPDLVFNAGGPTTITNTAVITGVANDPDLSDNQAHAATAVVAVADLEIVSFTAVDPPAEVLVGEGVTITLHKTITNNGPSGPMDAQLTQTAIAPPDSTVTPTATVTMEPALGLGELRAVTETFTITCGQASQHTFTFNNEIQPYHPEDSDPDPSNNTASVDVTVECVVPVALNIKPGSYPNSINPNSKGVIPLAVLTTMAGEYGTPIDFDATLIDPLSVRFGPPDLVWSETGGAFEAHDKGHIEDSYELDEVTQDGDEDMVLHFRTQETGIQAGDTQACVKGEWVDQNGMTHKFFGCDEIRTVPQ